MKKYLLLFLSFALLVIMIVLWALHGDRVITPFFIALCFGFTVLLLIIILLLIEIFTLKKRVDKLENKN